MRATFAAALFTAALWLAGCSERSKGPEPIGEAYAGPAKLVLRHEIAPSSGVAGSVKHGERLSIIRTRRSFVRVRTAAGVEGWTDARQLLTADEIAELKSLEEDARAMPSQGVASTYDLLNVHTAPDRRSPSFLQMKEGEKVDIVAQRVTPRLAGPPPKRKLLADTPAAAPPSPRKPKAEKYPKPPLPKPPGPPQDWLDLSKSPPEVEADVRAEAEPEKVVPTDDWYLVRNAAGQSGWVVANRVYLAIPDEVAQYAEGRRITSYLSLGQVKDGSQTKNHWVWTTIESGGAPYQFDGFRVFIWSLRRHRYETAYRERNLKGYYPVLLEKVEMSTSSGRRGTPSMVQYPGFSVAVEKEDGTRYRRRYAFIGNIVRFAGEAPEVVQTLPSGLAASRASKGGEAPANEPSMTQRFKESVGAIRKKLLGK